VMKGGFIAWAQMGDPNASIPTPEPVMMRPMWAAHGPKALGACCFAFVSNASIENGSIASYGLAKRAVPGEPVALARQPKDGIMDHCRASSTTSATSASWRSLACDRARRRREEAMRHALPQGMAGARPSSRSRCATQLLLPLPLRGATAGARDWRPD
jgi:hypothetical protein